MKKDTEDSIRERAHDWTGNILAMDLFQVESLLRFEANAVPNQYESNPVPFQYYNLTNIVK